MKTRKMKYIKKTKKTKKTKNKPMQKGGLYFFKKRNRTWKIADQYGKPPMDVESYRNAEVIVLNRIAKNCNGNYRECIQNIQGRLGELQNAIDRITIMDYNDYESYQAEYQQHIKPVLDNLGEVIKLRNQVNSLYADPDAHADVVVELIALEKVIKKATEKLTENYTLANKEEETVKARRNLDKLQAQAIAKQKEAEEAEKKLAAEKVAAQEARDKGEWPDDPELPENIKILNKEFDIFRGKVKYALRMVRDIKYLKGRGQKPNKDENIKIAKEKTHIDFLNEVFEVYSTFEDSYNELTDDAELTKSTKLEMITLNSHRHLQIMEQDLTDMSTLGIEP